MRNQSISLRCRLQIVKVNLREIYITHTLCARQTKRDPFTPGESCWELKTIKNNTKCTIGKLYAFFKNL